MQISNFIICGLLSAAIYYIFLYIGTELSEFNNYIVITAAFTISSSFNFFYNKNFTFKSRKKIGVEIMKYSLVLFISYLFNMFIIFILMEKLHFNIYFSSGLAIGIIATFRYISSKYFVYI